MAKIINGKEISEKIKEQLKAKTLELKQKGITPGLAVVLVGDNPASKTYVKNKKKACDYLGYYSEEHILPEQTTQQELDALIDKLNADAKIHGILVQLPLPAHLNTEEVIARISPQKDVDAFHSENVGKIMIGSFDFLPCTPAGVMTLLEQSGIDVSGKHCVVIGRSNIVGKPQAMLLLHKNATVTICHSKTRDLKTITRSADVIVCAIGKPKFLTADMVSDGAVVVDVGINRDENGKLCGDVDFENVEPKASYITPVPGGVGPMTIAMLMQNTMTAALRASSCQ